MKFEEWIATQDNCSPADWSSLGGAYRFWIEVARASWEAAWEDGRRTGVSAQVGWQDYLDRCDD